MEKVSKLQTETLEDGIMNFGSLAEEVSNLIKEGISSTKLRVKFKRIEEMAQKLMDKRDDVHSISLGISDFDARGLETRIRKLVIEEVKKTEAIVSHFLKDFNHASTAATAEAAKLVGEEAIAVIQREKLYSYPNFLDMKRQVKLFWSILFGLKIGNHKYWSMKKSTEQVC